MPDEPRSDVAQPACGQCCGTCDEWISIGLCAVAWQKRDGRPLRRDDGRECPSYRPTNAHLRANIIRVREQIRASYRGTRAWTAMACLTRAAELLEDLDRA